MKVKLINGPLHGREQETDRSEFMDLLDSEDGKVRRYRLGDYAIFTMEWPDKTAWEAAMGFSPVDGKMSTHVFTPRVMNGVASESCVQCGLPEGGMMHDHPAGS